MIHVFNVTVSILAILFCAMYSADAQVAKSANVNQQQSIQAVDTVVIKSTIAQRYYIKVFDVLGRPVMNKEIDSKEFALSSCQFAKGSYTYTITDSKNHTVKRGSFSVTF